MKRRAEKARLDILTINADNSVRNSFVNNSDAVSNAVNTKIPCDSLCSTPKSHVQMEHYNSYMPVLRERHACDWALIVDLDEYVYASPPEER